MSKNIELGQRIKNIRVTRKETLEQFANAIQKNAEKSIKTTKSNVSKWEKGLNTPNDIALHSIASLGAVSVNYLLTGESDSKIKLLNDIESLDKEIEYQNSEISEIQSKINDINNKLEKSSTNKETELLLENELEDLTKTKLNLLNLKDFNKNDLKKQKDKLSKLNDGLIFDPNDRINPEFKKNGISQKQIASNLQSLPYLLNFESTMKVKEYADMLLKEDKNKFKPQ